MLGGVCDGGGGISYPVAIESVCCGGRLLFVHEVLEGLGCSWCETAYAVAMVCGGRDSLFVHGLLEGLGCICSETAYPTGVCIGCSEDMLFVHVVEVCIVSGIAIEEVYTGTG
ncbi:hypothetical protein ABW19_dt0207119 [Dactylella cylindrospora]|nr:hypothetical protein ABW19_dt0207119 [Dactylella cylindrospora]